MLPAPGQGALGIQCRADDERLLRLLAPLDDPATRAAVTAERAFLAGMGGGCAIPLAALGTVSDSRVHLRGLYVQDGRPFYAEGEADVDEAEALGRRLAEEIKLQVASSKLQESQGSARADQIHLKPETWNLEQDKGLQVASSKLQESQGSARGGRIHLEPETWNLEQDKGLQVAGSKLQESQGSARADQIHLKPETWNLEQDKGLQVASSRLQEREGPARGEGRWRVLITRAAGQAEELAEKVQALGMEPVLYPTIRIAPPEDVAALDAALARLWQGAYDWLVLTSVNGVRFVWERLASLGAGEWPRGVKVAVIGPATARALAQHGIRPTLVPDEYVAEGLARALGDVRGQRFLLARADRARPTLREMLEAQGAQVDEVTAYRTVIAPPAVPPPEVDIITFTSPSTVQGFVAAWGDGPLPEHVRVVCIGPITARAAREAGLPVHAVAEEYTIDGLIAAIERMVE